MNINNSEEKNIVPLDEISFPDSFFREEVRNGFYITTMMKRYWAGQLQMLSDIDKLCKKHGIKWFADYGTLLGAVRHGGYIPWDDDFDIYMLRDDYERFFEIAPKEMPSVYIFLSLRDIEEGYDNFLGRIVNCNTIDCSEDHLSQFSGCPYTVGVDIFPMDGVYNDEEKEKERLERAQKAILVHDAVDAADELGDLAKNIESLVIDIEKENHVHLRRGKKLKHEIQKLIEKIYMECPVSEADRVAMMPFYLQYGNHVYPKKFMNKSFEMEFENTLLQVPCCYDYKLALDYGNYMEIHKGGGMHEYPVYISQEKALAKKIGHNPFRYTFDSNEMLVSVRRYMEKMLVPQKEKDKKTILFLPCRAIWWDTMEGLWHKYVSEGHDVHVLPISFYDTNFQGEVGEMHDERALFPDYLNVEDFEKFDYAGVHPDAIVIQVPYDEWNSSLTVHEFFYSSNIINATDELIYVPCFDIDDPIDSEDKACRSIEILAEQPAVVNADKVLLKSEKQRELYLRKLIGFSGEETRAFWENKIEVSPYVGRDWQKRVQSDGLADDTKNAVCAHAENIDASGHGHDEIQSADDAAMKQKWHDFLGEYAGRKAVVFYYTISTLICRGEAAIDKFERVLDTFAETAKEGKLVAIFVPQDYLTANLDKAEDDVRERYLAFVEKVKNAEGVIWDEDNQSLEFIDMWDAYYGDTGVIAMECANRKIPVMLENVDI